jgi:uncharacterized protein
LLARVSGLNATLARNIVDFRDANGPFPNRMALRKVPRLGDKTFEQAAGFLRIRSDDAEANPLDRSAVHPEAYPVVERILARIGKGIGEVMGQGGALLNVAASDFTDERFGLPTVRDILSELEKPGRDPRPEFKTASFKDGVESLSDLRPDLILEGVVTNVAAFGAFVDIGVHQDGLVHVSALSDRFVRDPREVVKAGQLVKVKVLEVDLQRQRVALTMRLADEPGAKPAARSQANRSGAGQSGHRGAGDAATRAGAARPDRAHSGRGQPGNAQTAMQAAFEALKKR